MPHSTHFVQFFDTAHIQYSILCWGFSPGRIPILQKRAIRLISRSKYNAHSEPIFKMYSLLKLNDIFNLCVLKFYYKLRNKSLPHYLQTMFHENEVQHPYDTRNRSLFRPFPSKISSSKCIRYILYEILDKTDKLVTEKTETHSPKGFANYAKNYFLNNYKSACAIPNCYICSS